MDPRLWSWNQKTEATLVTKSVTKSSFWTLNFPALVPITNGFSCFLFPAIHMRLSREKISILVSNMTVVLLVTAAQSQDQADICHYMEINFAEFTLNIYISPIHWVLTVSNTPHWRILGSLLLPNIPNVCPITSASKW